MDTTIPTSRVPEVHAPGSGHHFHFLNHLATVKVRGGGGAMSVVEFTAPRGFGPPLHRHHDEDELFVVLDGEVVFLIDDDRTVAVPGSIAHLPHAVPHTFQVLSPTAQFVTVTASLGRGARFDQMVVALGVPTSEPSVPEPTPIDPTHVADVCLAHGVDVLGPPPPPLS